MQFPIPVLKDQAIVGSPFGTLFPALEGPIENSPLF